MTPAPGRDDTTGAGDREPIRGRFSMADTVSPREAELLQRIEELEAQSAPAATPGRDDTTGAGDESASYGVSVESANPQVRTVVRPMSEVVALAALARRGFEGKSSWMDAADAILAAGWTPPAATPGRDELREQIAAARATEMRLRSLIDQGCTLNDILAALDEGSP